MSENTKNTVSNTPVSNQDVLLAVQAIDHKLTDHIEESKRTHDDILSAVNTSFTDVAVELHEIRQDISGMKGEIVDIKDAMVTKEEFKQEMVKVVTKEYLDDKLSDLKGDLVGLIRKEDRKVDTVVNILHDHKVLTGQDLEQINQVGLFPKANTKMTTT